MKIEELFLSSDLHEGLLNWSYATCCRNLYREDTLAAFLCCCHRQAVWRVMLSLIDDPGHLHNHLVFSICFIFIRENIFMTHITWELS